MASIQSLTKEVERLEKENNILKITIDNYIQQVKYIRIAIGLMQTANSHFKNVILDDLSKHIKEF